MGHEYVQVRLINLMKQRDKVKLSRDHRGKTCLSRFIVKNVCHILDDRVNSVWKSLYIRKHEKKNCVMNKVKTGHLDIFENSKQ